jgi:transposase
VGKNFRPVERDQQYLMPASLRDWLPADDLAWFVLDVVEQIDLSAIHARYRDDGWGAPAYDPALMVALLLYAYATGERSSRRIERLCERDIAYRVIAANQRPDHATIARFRAEHQAPLADLFGEILRLCARAGLGSLGLVALDGTKLAADASMDANRTAASLDAEIASILAEAAQTDAAEDERYGHDQRVNELPAEFADRHSRLARLAEARRQLAAAESERAAARPPAGAGSRPTLAVPSESAEPDPAAIARPGAGRRPGWAERNTTDPDARKMQTQGRWLVGYNGQAVVAADGLIIAAALTQQPHDYAQLHPMLAAARRNVRSAGFRRRIGTLVADAGYWSEANLAAVPAGGPSVLVVPTAGRSRSPDSQRPPAPERERMRRRLTTKRGRALMRRRSTIAEPVFGQLKEARGVRRFRRRGYPACVSEWQLLCATHNLLKLWRSRRGRRATGPGSPPPRRRREAGPTGSAATARPTGCGHPRRLTR